MVVVLTFCATAIKASKAETTIAVSTSGAKQLLILNWLRIGKRNPSLY